MSCAVTSDITAAFNKFSSNNTNIQANVENNDREESMLIEENGLKVLIEIPVYQWPLTALKNLLIVPNQTQDPETYLGQAEFKSVVFL